MVGIFRPVNGEGRCRHSKGQRAEPPRPVLGSFRGSLRNRLSLRPIGLRRLGAFAVSDHGTMCPKMDRAAKKLFLGGGAGPRPEKNRKKSRAPGGSGIPRTRWRGDSGLRRLATFYSRKQKKKPENFDRSPRRGGGPR